MSDEIPLDAVLADLADRSPWTADEWHRVLDAALSGLTVDGLLLPSTQYPRTAGAFLVLGPEIFTGDGTEQTQDVIMWRGAAYRRIDETGRSSIDEARAAYDQFRLQAGQSADAWHARAEAAAAIASAEQGRIGNLIAWKQLRQSSPTSSLPLAGDAISDEIESALGITDGSAS